MSTKLNSYGMSQTYVNGDKISDISYDATYNGKHIDIAARNGNVKTFMRLSNNDIDKLLNNTNSSQESLRDKISKHSKTKSRSKSIKKTRTTRKSRPTKSKTLRRKRRYKRKGKRSRKQNVKKSIPAIDREVIW